MKKIFLISIAVMLFSTCKNHDDENYVPGKIETQVSYKGVSAKQSATNKGKSDSLYIGFGDYITSLTPQVFNAKFTCIRFVDDLQVINQMELLDNNLPYKDPLKYADFTNGSSVTMNPTLGGNLINEGASFAGTVLFKYFYFRVEYFYQEVALPAQYSTIDTLRQFSAASASIDEDWNQVYSSLSNNVLKARYRLFLAPLYEFIQRLPDAFVFGGTDSSYVLNLFTDPHDFPNNLPYDGDYIVRSKKYTPITFEPSDVSDKTTLIKATLSFDYNNLIQVYAGVDNIPYTKDDVFLYEPNFFDRLLVNVTIE